MDTPEVLIADCNPEFRHSLASALEDHFHVHCCSTGGEALAILRQLHPQVLVLDLTLPELDGISLLLEASQDGPLPKVLATTPLVSGYITEFFSNLGIDYIMRQPCNVQAVAARVADLSKAPPVPLPAAQSYLADLLKPLGFISKHHGYDCILIAVVLTIQNPGQFVTKELYPAVGKLCIHPVPGTHVEKLIRYAINTAWDKSSPEPWAKYFELGIRPSNQVFITRMAEEVKTWIAHGGIAGE